MLPSTSQLLRWLLSIAVIVAVCACDNVVPPVGLGAYDPNGGLQDGSPTPTPRPRETKIDTFSGEYTQKNDFLVVIDDSGSMQQEIDAVKDGVDDFVTALNTNRIVDFQVALTTTNARRYAGDLLPGTNAVRVIKSATTVNPEQEWRSILNSIVISGPSSSVEMGYRAAELAITRFGTEFSRPNVPLAVVIFSDEEDQSKGSLDPLSPFLSNGALLSEDYYVNFFKAKSSLMYPIVGLRDAAGNKACAEIESLGDRYKSIHTKIGTGALGSICNGAPLANSFNAVGEMLARRGVCFKLKSEATGQQFTVTVDGATVPMDKVNGFFYETGTNSVCFPGSFILNDGQDIVVKYQAWKN